MANGKFGVKWSELLIPGALGVIGSMNRDTGRGVGLGIQAYNILKSQQKDPAEEEAKKKLSEHFKERAEELRTQQTTMARGRALEDIDETGQFGFFKEAGPTMPTPTLDLGRETVRASDQFGLGMDQQEAALLAAREAGGLPSPQESELQRGLAQGIPGVQDVDFEAREGAVQERMSEILPEMDTGDIRFNEIMSQLAAVNPASAGYLAGQFQSQETKDRLMLNRMYEQDKLYAKGREQQSALEIKQRNLAHAQNMEIAQEKALVQEKWSPITNSLGSFLVNKITGDVRPIGGAEDILTMEDFLGTMSPEQILNQHAKYGEDLRTWLKPGESLVDVMNSQVYKDIKAMFDNLDDYVKRYELLPPGTPPPDPEAAERERQRLELEAELGISPGLTGF
jgi:hypothetical protein